LCGRGGQGPRLAPDPNEPQTNSDSADFTHASEGFSSETEKGTVSYSMGATSSLLTGSNRSTRLGIIAVPGGTRAHASSNGDSIWVVKLAQALLSGLKDSNLRYVERPQDGIAVLSAPNES